VRFLQAGKVITAINLTCLNFRFAQTTFWLRYLQDSQVENNPNCIILPTITFLFIEVKHLSMFITHIYQFYYINKKYNPSNY